MSQNPFDALSGGLGGLDLGALMQQAQQMQSDLQAAQQRLADTVVEGTVAGGAVSVSLTGAGELTAVTITPEALDGTDAEALSDLGDLVVAAFRDARAKVDALAEEAMGPLAGGMPGLPGVDGPGQAPGPLGF
ncbi:YbaB/EbfC family nucleoid-associated protein [Nocardioides caeni]|uniref:Nucleoid-associated protein E9934_10875 n=1 Tax=Nocardioides caeni TaxID=574700 RepID=A0A4S8N994_9ACTN|nr:YbaB/EbfC family nucleoid-associated protein [Nocardioides caeni]THV12888.1 YbaB/EbfC family nucleoid-associated protein [Nocardioides caeni]